VRRLAAAFPTKSGNIRTSERQFFFIAQSERDKYQAFAPECRDVFSSTRSKEDIGLSRILLIDDTPEIAELLTFALRDRGHEVFTEGFTDTVDDLIGELKADALVLDCSTFDMNDGLFEIVRGNPKHAELPVVIISDTPEMADAALTRRNAQNVLLIPKPFTGSQVARALDDLLK